MMDMVLEQLKDILAGVTAGSGNEPDMAAVTPASHLYDDLGLDSVVLLMMVIGIEDTFGIRFPTAEAAACKTVGDVVALIEREQAAK